MHTDNLISKMVGSNLKKLRKEAGYTNSQFATLVNKSDQQMHRYEKGVNKIDIDTLLKALKILNVDIGDFFNQLTVNDEGAMADTNDNYIKTKLILGIETAGINF